MRVDVYALMPSGRSVMIGGMAHHEAWNRPQELIHNTILYLNTTKIPPWYRLFHYTLDGAPFTPLEGIKCQLT